MYSLLFGLRSVNIDLVMRFKRNVGCGVGVTVRWNADWRRLVNDLDTMFVVNMLIECMGIAVRRDTNGGCIVSADLLPSLGFDKLKWGRVAMRWVTGRWDVISLFMHDVSLKSLAWGVAITSKWMRVTVRRYAYRWTSGSDSSWIGVVSVMMMVGITMSRGWMRVTMRRNTDRWAGSGYSRWISFVSIMIMVVVVVVVVMMMEVVARRRMWVTMRWYTNRRTGCSHFGRTFHYRDSSYRSCIMSRCDMSLTSELITPRRIVRNSGSLMLGCVSLMEPGGSSIFR